MIATHCKTCGSEVCDHMVSHQERPDCRGENGWCRHSPECRCVPDSPKELVEQLFASPEFCTLTEKEVIDTIDAIYREGTA